MSTNYLKTIRINRIITIFFCFLIVILYLFKASFFCLATAYTDVDNDNVSDEMSIKIKSSKPELNCVDDIQKNVIIEWKEIEGATKYNIYRAESKNGNYTKIKELNKLFFTDKKAKKRKTYYYKVEAVREVRNDTGDIVSIYSKMSNAKKIYVRPQKPKMVLCGECYVEGIQYYAPKQIPTNMTLISKVGINTTNILNLNYFNGKTAIDTVCDCNPDRVYFLVGANEFMNNNPKATINNFNKMRKKLIKNNSNIEIILIKISPQGKTGRDKEKVIAREKYNNAYKKFAKKYKNVYFCNVTDFMDDGLGTLAPNCDAGDGCHWTPYAAEEMMLILKLWSEKRLGTW